MKELTFFTSNPIKLSHARHIAEGHPLKIKGFRQRTYHASYHEPRLSSRDEILMESYRSALQQLTKSGLSPDSHPFILEDTSVRIEALSDDIREMPGVDVKYWMEEMTFEALDSLISKRGGSRNAIVKSHVLLHVPTALKQQWGVQSDFVIFEGAQAGQITTSEQNFETNLVFPWLDNQSFNKWFVPRGALAPLGALPIDQADQYDFRKKSFSQLIEFLGERGYLKKDSQQKELSLGDRPPAILFCGYTCAGKTTASQHLSRKHGFLHLEASDFMHLAYLNRHGVETRVPIGDFAEQALAQRPLIAAERVAEFINENSQDPIVVSGFRSPDEADFLRKELEAKGRYLFGFFIEANPHVRYERMRHRMRPGDDIEEEEFQKRDDQQARMGLEDLRRQQGIDELKNERSLPEFFEALDALEPISNGLPSFAEPSFLELEQLSDIALEDAILIALLTVWNENEDREYFTTTEIAKLIERVLPNAGRKHKDNVSRYFNQDYYPFYDIDKSARSGALAYSLSNTGYGIAYRALRVQLTKLSNEARR